MAFGMGAWCRDLQPAGVINGVPGNHFELADQTATTTVQTLATKAKFFRAVVYVKNVITGGSVTYSLEAASTAVLPATGKAEIDSFVVQGSVGSYSFILSGFAPDASVGGLGFVRVTQTGAAGGQTYDCILDAL